MGRPPVEDRWRVLVDAPTVSWSGELTPLATNRENRVRTPPSTPARENGHGGGNAGDRPDVCFRADRVGGGLPQRLPGYSACASRRGRLNLPPRSRRPRVADISGRTGADHTDFGQGPLAHGTDGHLPPRRRVVV